MCRTSESCLSHSLYTLLLLLPNVAFCVATRCICFCYVSPLCFVFSCHTLPFCCNTFSPRFLGCARFLCCCTTMHLLIKCCPQCLCSCSTLLCCCTGCPSSCTQCRYNSQTSGTPCTSCVAGTGLNSSGGCGGACCLTPIITYMARVRK